MTEGQKYKLSSRPVLTLKSLGKFLLGLVLWSSEGRVGQHFVVPGFGEISVVKTKNMFLSINNDKKLKEQSEETHVANPFIFFFRLFTDVCSSSLELNPASTD